MNKDQKTDVIQEESPIKAYGFGHRHIQSVMLFLVMCVSSIMRSNVSVAIIAMTDKSSNITGIEVYDWDKKTQNYVLGSFFWGYMIMQIPASQLAQRFGVKKPFSILMFVNGAASLLFAHIVYLGGWQAACGVRMIQGMTQSCMMPGVQIFLSKWAPLSERSRIASFVMSGIPFGIILSMPTVGFLSGRFGWPVSFQVIGGIAMVTGVMWVWMCSDRPSLHPRISEEEREFIQSSLGQSSEHKVVKTPWRALLTSRPFLALLVTYTGCYWGYITMLLETPTYLKLVLGVSSEQSGLYSALPYISTFISSYALSFLSDFLINRKILSITASRKIFNTIACGGLGFGILIMSFMPVDRIYLPIAVLIIANGLWSAFNVGSVLNVIDLAPNLAGSLMGITNSVASTIGVFAPLSVGYILKDPYDITQWKIIFVMLCVIMNGTNLIFVIFGTSETQQWNTPQNDGDIEMKKNSSDDSDADKQLLNK